jgi:hypothetical protein
VWGFFVVLFGRNLPKKGRSWSGRSGDEGIGTALEHTGGETLHDVLCLHV